MKQKQIKENKSEKKRTSKKIELSNIKIIKQENFE